MDNHFNNPINNWQQEEPRIVPVRALRPDGRWGVIWMTMSEFDRWRMAGGPDVPTEGSWDDKDVEG